MAWLNASALWGLALVAIPIAIHLLVREQTRTVAYPSLRFVRDTALAAFRRRAIQDAVLLLCRSAILAVAVLAIAGPIMQTASRTAAYAQRISRAIVRLDDTSVAESLRADAFRSRTFARVTIGDALNDAVRWLDAQPPSAREVVFVGAFRRGQISETDFLALPAGVGVRFAAAERTASGNEFIETVLTRRNGRLVFAKRNVRLSTDATQVAAAAFLPAAPDAVRIVAAAKDQSLAEAALQAALDAGVRWSHPDRRVLLVWEGAAESSLQSSRADVIRMPVPDQPATAATAIWTAIDDATPQEAAEPDVIARADLNQWSRPAGPPSAGARPGDEGDRRWLWAAALALLAVEQWLRRERTRAAEPHEARRVA
jgi:hypothetical protein